MDKSTENHLLALGHKAVAALERLAQDPIIEVEAAPPLCPHCGKFNPTIKVEAEVDGPIVECVIPSVCQECGRTFYAMPITWHMHPSLESVRQELAERTELIQNGNN